MNPPKGVLERIITQKEAAIAKLRYMRDVIGREFRNNIRDERLKLSALRKQLKSQV